MKKDKHGAEGFASIPDEEIIREVQAFNRERDRIRTVLASIGQEKGSIPDRLANALFLGGLAFLLYLRFVAGWVDNILSLELGLLLVSVKILWMIRMQVRYNHFLFWIVHSIEFRQNELLGKTAEIKAMLEGRAAPAGKDPQ